MRGGHDRALRDIEEMRLQMAVDRLVATGALQPEAALHAPGPLERVLGERGLLGCELEALRRQARQQRRHALEQQLGALRQRDYAAGQWSRVARALPVESSTR